MLTTSYSSILGAILVAPLPWLASSYPSVGGFIVRPSNRMLLFGATAALAVCGLIVIRAGLLPSRIGLCFFAPLWQILITRVLYAVWFRFNKRAPVNVTFNWKSGLFWHRVMAMAILLLGVVPFLFIISPQR
jgi:hypothetical protein